MKKVAIYSRKSLFTGKGDSIGNQIELCKQHIMRYNENENFEFLIYEDEGFSGGNTNRPEFQRLLKDAKSKKFDVLMCYRLDRISRNVADFSSTIEMLQDYNIDFISIKEQFDTTSPMGRAMMYISSVFAQLERETIAERVRDNLIQLAKTGRWLGGQAPLGFIAKKSIYFDEEMKERSLMKLTPIESELTIIKTIYEKYLEYRSITQVLNYILQLNIKGKNKGDFSSMQLARILSNPMYVKSDDNTHDYLKRLGMNVYGVVNGNGYLTYNKTKNNRTANRDISEHMATVSNHKGIISSDKWIEVQKILKSNRHKKVKRLGTGKNNALLTGILKCAKCGSNILIANGGSKKNGTARQYYVCSKRKNNRNVNKCDNANITVERLDSIVKKELLNYNKDFLVELLDTAIKENDSQSISIKKEDLENIIKEKELLISNLVKKLSISPSEEVSKYLFDEINKLNDDIALAKNNLIDLDNTENNIKAAIQNVELLKVSFDKLKNIENEDSNQRRFIIQSIIKEAIWDGDNMSIKIDVLGNKKK